MLRLRSSPRITAVETCDVEAGRVLNIEASSTGDDVELVVGVVGCEYSFAGVNRVMPSKTA